MKIDDNERLTLHELEANLEWRELVLSDVNSLIHADIIGNECNDGEISTKATCGHPRFSLICTPKTGSFICLYS